MEEPPAWTSGTRIKARTTTTVTSSADGAEHEVTSFVGWYDSMRSEPCTPSKAADSKTRCLPTAVALQNFYVDAGCTMAAALTFTSCDAIPPKYVSLSPPASCPQPGPKLYAAGTATSTYYTGSPGNCNGPTTNAAYTFYPASGAEIPATSFAEMTVMTTTTP